MATLDPVEQALVRDAAVLAVEHEGPIAEMADRYRPDAPDSFWGLLLGLSYDGATIVTDNGWKRGCGGEIGRASTSADPAARARDAITATFQRSLVEAHHQTRGSE